MGNPTEFDRELLSAYLDDALAADERSHAEHLLATDAGASRYLDQLRATRECLKSVAGSKLRSSLSARVIEQARVQALAEGLPSDHHVLRGSVNSSNKLHGQVNLALPIGAALQSGSAGTVTGDVPAGSVTDTSNKPAIPSEKDLWSPKAGGSAGSNRLMWSALAAAAAVIIAVAVLPLSRVDRPHELVAELAPNQPVTEDEIVGDASTALSPVESVAASEVSEPATVEGNDPFGHNEPAAVPNAVAHVRASQQPHFDYLMIIDAVVSADAWENGRFEGILAELGIPIVSPIVADQDLFKVLEETRVVVGSSLAEASEQQPRAALVFLRAEGATLDRLHRAMHADRDHFPQVVTDISIDSLNPQTALLHQLLRGQASTQSPDSASAQVLSASADTNTGGEEDLVPHFVAAERPQMARSAMQPAPANAGLAGLDMGGDSPMSEVLVILRESSSK